MTAAISQRLVRQLCTKCSVPETNLSLVRRVPTSLRNSSFRTHNGCGECRATGYSGRMAVFEMLRVTALLRPLIESKASETRILEAARSDGFQSLFYNGVALAAKGQTSLDEVVHFAHPFFDAEVFTNTTPTLEKAA